MALNNVDLLLVNPGNRMAQFANLNPLATVAPPLGIAMLAAYVREHGISVAVIDAEAEFWSPEQAVEEIKKYNPLVVGLSAFTTKMGASEKIMELVKAWNSEIYTIVGGHHSSAIPIEVSQLPYVDFAIAGEGYRPTLELIEDLKAGGNGNNIEGVFSETQGNGRSIFEGKIDTLPPPAWDLLPMDKYRGHHWQGWGRPDADLSKFSLLHTSVGCPFSCAYCSVNMVYGKNYVRYIEIESVVDKLEVLVRDYGVKFIEIIDDTFTVNTKRVHELCDAIIARGLGDEVEMWAFARTDRTDADLLKKMRKAGITWVFMGLESGADEILQGVNKKQTVTQIKDACNKVWDAGIYIGGNYMFGHRKDNHDTMQITLDLALELNTEYANFFVTMAYPGTEYYDLAKEENYPLPQTWDQYGFFAPDSIPLENDQLTYKEILSFRDDAFIKYFSNNTYQDMIRGKFGQGTVDYINNHILSKKLTRV